MATTKIEWADAVWNPITGCTPISEGCANCYAKRMANRLKGRAGYPADDPFRVTIHNRFDEPLRWRKPRRVFVCSMGDLFHDDVPHSALDRIFSEMILEYEHTFLVLTKRPERMLEYFNSASLFRNIFDPNIRLLPSPNLWIGVTAENQARAEERIPILLQIPAAVRFVSIEPMLGQVDLRRAFGTEGPRQTYIEQLDWVICGGETGPGARPVHPDWVRSLRDQCQAAVVPFFFKQWGEWGPYISAPDHFMVKYWDNGIVSLKTGKKLSGRLLDGREWNEFPTG